MTKAEVMKEARAKRDSERETLSQQDISLDDYIVERKRINGEYLAIKEANKPTHQRIPAWQRADNEAFGRWCKLQNK